MQKVDERGSQLLVEPLRNSFPWVEVPRLGTWNSGRGALAPVKD